ncbi:MAG TPA: 4-hydroxy-tetrahydrodipicolinate reductase [Sandaracinaceae bacterium LLY-WYZ-13_1]|nr:4-hydroxy-tetrahydrodipicolinate reductase [Sandaracinaceae bacterium LLY-WYZ-13_1]
MSTRIAVSGATGRMGRAIVRVVAEEAGCELVQAFTHAEDPSLGRDAGEVAGVGTLAVPVAALDGDSTVDADVLVEFSTPEGAALAADRCDGPRVPLVSGTTGLDDGTLAKLDALAQHVPVVVAPNMSVGVTLLFHLAELATRTLGADFDPEIVEMHHRHKVDAPSGTAVRLAERVAQARELDPKTAVVHGRSGRTGPRPDEEIGVMTLRGGGVIGEHTLHLAGAGERLELTHRAQDRSIFARGAVRAARWVVGKHPARYDMADVLGLAR